MSKADIGVIGLAVMGENLILNMESKGFTVAVYNRTTEKVTAFTEGRAKGKNIIGSTTLEDFVQQLQPPRRVMIMVKAGKPVDAVIEQLIPLLEKGDIIIDGGNSNFNDTERRKLLLEEKGLLFIGTGVSGGEEGALLGPSMMPGGSPEAWEHVQDIFEKIAAQVDNKPCTTWIGKGGAGHFVKMVHNGIEYGDMQLICESYDILRTMGKSNDELHTIFSQWNKSELDSYLIDITSQIFAKKENGEYVVDIILDTAGQKGTGKWTAIESLQQGIPLTIIGEAVFARFLSALKEERVEASKELKGEEIDVPSITEDEIKDALYAAKIMSYAQGFALIHSAASEYHWSIKYGEVAAIWRGGCIIRSAFLNDITTAFQKNPTLNNLMLDDFFKEQIHTRQKSLRKVVSFAIAKGIPVPALSAAITYFDGYRREHLPANLLQAQRDFFGAHTYERLDKDRGEFFHTNWTGKGGSTSSSTYNA
jgi:6-phosphogluconate dehydrogenase